jgi:phage tail-like protein
MSVANLPPIPRPPHDPTSLLLNKRLGWSLLETDKIAISRGAVALERFPGSLRWLTEASGSFGGLRTPANVAIGSDGIIWLLDASILELKRFDPCDCEFKVVPCFGGEGSGPRQLLNPGGIDLYCDDLYVCDTGNARLSVFVFPTLALRGHWKPPTPWQPTGVVVDEKGTAYVADPLNGQIHRFSRHGSYLGHWDGFGAIKHLAIDRHGDIYAAGDLQAFRVGSHGEPIPITSPADDIASDFKPLRFKVDTSGNLHLGSLCTPPTQNVFDLNGDLIALGPQAQVQLYERSGTAIIGPLDSLIDSCTWHRVVLGGEMPEGGRVEIQSFTSHIDLPQSEIDQLPEHAWESNLQFLSLKAVDSDGLFHSPQGRYMWLRITLKGNGQTTPRIESFEIEFPRISLRRYMPAVYGAEPVSSEFTDRFLSLFDRPLRDVESKVDNLAALFDPLSTPVLDWLASWVGVPLDRQLTERQRREYLKRAPSLNDCRGTRQGLWLQLISYLGMENLRTFCQCDVEPCSCSPAAKTCPPTPPHQWTWEPPPLILEHFKLRRWLFLGSGRLGDQAQIWGKRIVNRSQLDEGAQVGVTQLKATQDPLRDPFHVYAHKFTVFVPACAGRTPEKRRSLENLIKNESPGHAEGNIEYVQARFRIGFQSMIGLDSVVARIPQGVTLGQTPIGPASVLTGDDDTMIGESRLGTTARLN